MARRIDPNDHRARFRGRLLHRSEDKRRGLRRGPRSDVTKPAAQIESALYLRNWRLHRGLTQREAGQHFDVFGSEISTWERRGVAASRVREVMGRLRHDAEATGFPLEHPPAPLQRERAAYVPPADDDPWQALLAYVRGRVENSFERVRASDVMIYILDVGKNDGCDRLHRVAWRIGVLMRRLGWDGPKTVWLEKRRVRGYERAITKM